MTIITGRAEMLLGRLRPDDPLHRDIELFRKTSARAAAVTRQLLAFSRRQVLQPKVLDLNAVVAGMDSMLRRLIGEDIDLVTVLEPALWCVRADPGQLEQVMLNLAVNARDAMPTGGKLTIETGNVELDEGYASRHVAVKPGSFVLLAVSDTGMGMDEATRSRIFEPFFTTKEQGEGTGLGLATVYGIVKQSGGSIWCYSEPGQGTAFKIYLPRVDEAVESLEPAPPAAEPQRGTETVLLAEDEDELRSVAREILEMYGYTVLEAHHPDEALLIAERHSGPIPVLVTDVVMPKMSGRDLARRLAPLRPEMRVLYISGYTDEAIVRHGVLDPGTAFLEKPFNPDELARKVREVLDRA
jgi:CheY-like chemotaxis protein